VDGVTGIILISPEGLAMASELPEAVDPDLFSATAVTVYASCEKTITGIDFGKPSMISIEADEGKIFLVNCGEGILGVLTDNKVNLGLLRIMLSRTSKKVMDMLSGVLGGEVEEKVVEEEREEESEEEREEGEGYPSTEYGPTGF
jgi:hypothetical protein